MKLNYEIYEDFRSGNIVLLFVKKSRESGFVFFNLGDEWISRCLRRHRYIQRSPAEHEFASANQWRRDTCQSVGQIPKQSELMDIPTSEHAYTSYVLPENYDDLSWNKHFYEMKQESNIN
jgi:hypothetical protein